MSGDTAVLVFGLLALAALWAVWTWTLKDTAQPVPHLDVLAPGDRVRVEIQQLSGSWLCIIDSIQAVNSRGITLRDDTHSHAYRDITNAHLAGGHVTVSRLK